MHLRLRDATAADAAALSAIARQNQDLVVDVSHPDAARFLSSLSTPGTAERLAHPDYRTFVAEDDDGVAGYLALRGTHLYHLFVRRDAHRRGVGGRLWAHARDAIDADCITVNASTFAEPFYARVGFVATGPRHDGVPSYVPMEWRRR